MWIQLVQYKRFKDKSGRFVLHYPGEVLDIKNKALCKELIANKVAVDMRMAGKQIPEDSGVLMRRSGRVPEWVTALEMQVDHGAPALPFSYTIIWNPSVEPRQDMLVPTLSVLKRCAWDIAAPIYSYGKLANKIGNAQERARLKGVIHDLRVPCYNVGLLFCKRNERTTAVIERWTRIGGDERLAFLQAVYEIKPFLLPLPQGWIRKP